MNSLLTKTGRECDLPCNVASEHKTFTIDGLNEVTGIGNTLTVYEDMVALRTLLSSSVPENTIYTYGPTFAMALTDATSRLECPTKMIISTALFSKLFREVMDRDELNKLEFSGATSRDFLISRLYGHILFMDIHAFCPDNEFTRSIENDIFLVDTIGDPILFSRNETLKELESGYNLEQRLSVEKPKKISRIHVYR